jgi:hypothetical protein
MARHRFAIFHSLFSILVLLPAGGCNIFGPVATIVAGPPSVPAVYRPAKESMLLLVENFQHPTQAYADAEMLARTLHDELQRQKVAPLVPLEKLYALRTNRPDDYRNMSIAAVGRELGAKQVLYVDLQQASIDAATGSDLLRGRVTVQLRIVDTATGQSRWPEDAAEGYPLSYESPTPRNEDATNMSVVRTATYRGVADRIARLFRKWQPANAAPQI